MSRLDTSGGFGGPRVVKPQANVYTVLLLVATLCVIAALVWEWVVIIPGLSNPPQSTPSQKPAARVVVEQPALASQSQLPTIERIA